MKQEVNSAEMLLFMDILRPRQFAQITIICTEQWAAMNRNRKVWGRFGKRWNLFQKYFPFSITAVLSLIWLMKPDPRLSQSSGRDQQISCMRLPWGQKQSMIGHKKAGSAQKIDF